jgi:RNA polymerase sigma-70 factor (ECF subfamily)
MIQRIRNGNAGDFRILVDTYKEKVYHLCLGVLSNTHDAEEATQETFIKVYKKLSIFQGRSSFSTWLYRISYNTAIDCKRKRRRNTALSLDVLIEQKGDKVEKLFNRNSSESEENTALVRDILQALPDEYSELLFMKMYQGMSYADMADYYNCTVDSIKSKLFRARRYVEEKLQHLYTVSPSK